MYKKENILQTPFFIEVIILQQCNKYAFYVIGADNRKTFSQSSSFSLSTLRKTCLSLRQKQLLNVHDFAAEPSQKGHYLKLVLPEAKF